MRQKRAKAYRKLMSLYCMTFGFRQPYQVLVDAEMCKAAVLHKLDFVKQIADVLQGNVKPMITQCCIHELYLQGKSQQPAVDLAKTFERRKCNHREPIGGDECLTSVIGDSNKHRYVVATQSQALRGQLRAIPAVPLVHVTRSVMILEPPADATLRAKALAEEKILLPSATEVKQLASGSQASEAPSKKKRKGPKGPNPLSVKKKRVQASDTKKVASKKAVATADSAEAGEKRKRSEDDTVQINISSAENTGHKRKRRRKAAAQQAAGEQAEA